MISWVARPDMISQAINLLVMVGKALIGAIICLGGALIAVLLYIWHQTKGQIGSLETQMRQMATSLSDLAGHIREEIATINTRCDERHTMRRRRDDPQED